jgi:NADH:ubiquinone oxidoreductase subunit E
MNPVDVQSIIDKYDHKRGGLIGMLQEIQSRYSYLPREALVAVAERNGRSLVDIYGVATFYKSFSLEPRGKHLCSVCLGTACHVRNAPVIAEEFEKQLDITPGHTTRDREFTLETVNCLGACALGPMVVIDGHYFSNVRSSMVEKIIDRTRAGLDDIQVKTDARIFPVEVSCARCNHNLMDQEYLIDGHPSIRVTVAFGRQHGWLRLSSLYGSHSVEAEYETPKEAVVNFFCPHCHSELTGSNECPECSAPMVPMIVRGGGIVQICSRSGCKGHLLDVV